MGLLQTSVTIRKSGFSYTRTLRRMPPSHTGFRQTKGPYRCDRGFLFVLLLRRLRYKIHPMNKWHRRVSYAIIIAMCLPRGYIGGLRVAAVVVCIIPAMELAWALQ